jgi:hypothetical protein
MVHGMAPAGFWAAPMARRIIMFCTPPAASAGATGTPGVAPTGCGADASHGRVEVPLDLDQAIACLRAADIEAVAVCFLHSWRDPRHEQIAAEAVRHVMSC